MRKLLIIPAVISLLCAYFDRRAGRLKKAKSRIELIKIKYSNMFEFLDAFHGTLLIEEGDVEGGLKLLENNIHSLPVKKNDDQRYIELYCKYFLDAGKEDFDWQRLISEAHLLNADDFTKRMLVLPTEKRLISAFAS